MEEDNYLYPQYNPEISKEIWLKLLHDENIFNYNSMCIMHRMLDFGKGVSNTELAKKYGNSANFYTGTGNQLAQRIIKKTNCKKPPYQSVWPVLFLGRKVVKNDKDDGGFIWKLRPELEEALNKMNENGELEKYPLYENHISEWKNLIQKYKEALKEDPNQAFEEEKYKWQAITNCKNKTWQETLLYFAKESINLFEPRALNNAKKIVDDSSYNQLFENLFDENISLDNRLENYKEKMFSVSPNYKFNDERFASVFLTCHNPQAYTFYKDSYYGKLCDYLKIKKESAGKKYSHYLSLISGLENCIKQDSELMEAFSALTKDYVQSTKLIAQNIIYVCFENGAKFVNLDGELKMSTKNLLVTKLADLLLHTHNLILNGAPGTGKTYLAKEIAKKMNAETDFVQFHPSYDYTDFVEGLRPVKNYDGTSIGFERKDGVFKEFCKRALLSKTENLVDNYNQVMETFVAKLEENDNQGIDIPLLSGKSTFRIALNSYGDGFVTLLKQENGNYEKDSNRFYNFEQCYRVYKNLPGVPKGGLDNYRKAIVAFLKKNYGLKEYNPGTVNNNSNKPFVFIIDEINRGELSKIFGELFYAIDPGYRVKYEDLKKHQSGEKPLTTIRTQYANLETDGNEFDKALNIKDMENFGHFFVPENVYIIGTMNDIDRSVDTMDFAFRRRFTFCEVKAEENLEMLDGLGGLKDEAEKRMRNLNIEISKTDGLSSSYHIGGAYFLKLNDFDGDSDEKFNQLWKYHLEGLLREYLRGMENAEEKLETLQKAYFGNQNQAHNDGNATSGLLGQKS